MPVISLGRTAGAAVLGGLLGACSAARARSWSAKASACSEVRRGQTDSFRE
ncbi:hypothetical protein [Nonomuraea basaltis]|uniref:hypothetical protein n=1 Tax=Nonomuraea basaltis TaxID=2495887 RepID=UPI001485D6A3|nr:hypothetical protein [Nonomuraea basaltis]